VLQNAFIVGPFAQEQITPTPLLCKDQRVAGIVLLDGYAYRTLGFYIHDYGPRTYSILKKRFGF